MRWLLVLLMTALATIRPHLAPAKGLDFSSEADVCRAVDLYCEQNGDKFEAFWLDREAAANAVLFFPRY